MKNLVLFASGGGSSVENIAKVFQDEEKINIAAIYCNNPNAGLFKRNWTNHKSNEFGHETNFSK